MGSNGDRALLALLGWMMREETQEVPFAIRDTLLPEHVRRHRLAGLAHDLGLPGYREDFIRSALSAELWKQGLGEVLAAFSDTGIDACRLKGCAYFLDVYDDPGHRSMGDLDILVRPQDFDRAGNVLRELGYASRTTKDFVFAPTHHALTFDRRSLTVDLHRNMMQAGRSSIDIEAIWDRADLDKNRPSPLDELALHIAHIVRSELMVPLASFVDLSLLLRQSGVSRSQVVAHCDAYRLGRGARVVLAMHDVLQAGNESRGSMYPIPSTLELAREAKLKRLRVLLTKACLVDGPRELYGLARTTFHERSQHWQR